MSNTLLQIPVSEPPQQKIANGIANTFGKSANSKSKYNQGIKMFSKYISRVVLFSKQFKSIVFVCSKLIVDENPRWALYIRQSEGGFF